MSALASELLPLGPLCETLAKACENTDWLNTEIELLSGGKSNLTFILRSAAGELILRRPPTGELLPTAHDMARETRVQAALERSSVPVPQIRLVDHGGLFGFPFYIMEKVNGHVVRDALPPGYATSEAERLAIGNAFVDTLATLHNVDYSEVGLGNFGNPEGFLNRQVRRWRSQWKATTFGQAREVDELGARLATSVPQQRRAALLHGDYRLDNIILDLHEPSRIRAVLDWELSTVGDPITDLALLLFFWRKEGEPTSSLVPGVSHLPGFPTRDQLLTRYTSRVDGDAYDLDWYLAFVHFKFAVITQGVFDRSQAGAMGGQDFGDLAEEVLGLAQRGLSHLPTARR